jgi:hypothetical protein
VVPSGVERKRFQRTGHRPGRRAASRRATAAMGRSEQMVTDSEETLLEMNPAMFRNHPIRDVRNIEIDQSVFQRMFGVGSIGIASAGQSGIEIQFAGIRDPDGVKTLIDRYRDL